MNKITLDWLLYSTKTEKYDKNVSGKDYAYICVQQSPNVPSFVFGFIDYFAPGGYLDSDKDFLGLPNKDEHDGKIHCLWSSIPLISEKTEDTGLLLVETRNVELGRFNSWLLSIRFVWIPKDIADKYQWNPVAFMPVLEKVKHDRHSSKPITIEIPDEIQMPEHSYSDNVLNLPIWLSLYNESLVEKYVIDDERINKIKGLVLVVPKAYKFENIWQHYLSEIPVYDRKSFVTISYFNGGLPTHPNMPSSYLFTMPPNQDSVFQRLRKENFVVFDYNKPDLSDVQFFYLNRDSQNHLSIRDMLNDTYVVRVIVTEAGRYREKLILRKYLSDLMGVSSFSLSFEIIDKVSAQIIEIAEGSDNEKVTACKKLKDLFLKPPFHDEAKKIPESLSVGEWLSWVYGYGPLMESIDNEIDKILLLFDFYVRYISKDRTIGDFSSFIKNYCADNKIVIYADNTYKVIAHDLHYLDNVVLFINNIINSFKFKFSRNDILSKNFQQEFLKYLEQQCAIFDTQWWQKTFGKVVEKLFDKIVSEKDRKTVKFASNSRFLLHIDWWRKCWESKQTLFEKGTAADDLEVFSQMTEALAPQKGDKDWIWWEETFNFKFCKYFVNTILTQLEQGIEQEKPAEFILSALSSLEKYYETSQYVLRDNWRVLEAKFSELLQMFWDNYVKYKANVDKEIAVSLPKFFGNFHSIKEILTKLSIERLTELWFKFEEKYYDAGLFLAIYNQKIFHFCQFSYNDDTEIRLTFLNILPKEIKEFVNNDLSNTIKAHENYDYYVVTLAYLHWLEKIIAEKDTVLQELHINKCCSDLLDEMKESMPNVYIRWLFSLEILQRFGLYLNEDTIIKIYEYYTDTFIYAICENGTIGENFNINIPIKRFDPAWKEVYNVQFKPLNSFFTHRHIYDILRGFYDKLPNLRLNNSINIWDSFITDVFSKFEEHYGLKKLEESAPSDVITTLTDEATPQESQPLEDEATRKAKVTIFKEKTDFIIEHANNYYEKIATKNLDSTNVVEKELIGALEKVLKNIPFSPEFKFEAFKDYVFQKIRDCRSSSVPASFLSVFMKAYIEENKKRSDKHYHETTPEFLELVTQFTYSDVSVKLFRNIFNDEILRSKMVNYFAALDKVPPIDNDEHNSEYFNKIRHLGMIVSFVIIDSNETYATKLINNFTKRLNKKYVEKVIKKITERNKFWVMCWIDFFKWYEKEMLINKISPESLFWYYCHCELLFRGGRISDLDQYLKEVKDTFKVHLSSTSKPITIKVGKENFDVSSRVKLFYQIYNIIGTFKHSDYIDYLVKEYSPTERFNDIKLESIRTYYRYVEDLYINTTTLNGNNYAKFNGYKKIMDDICENYLGERRISFSETAKRTYDAMFRARQLGGQSHLNKEGRVNFARMLGIKK